MTYLRAEPKLLLLLLAVLATGCATTGTGFGSTPSGANRIKFAWKSSDSVSGEMNATLPDGTNYAGHFFQINSNTRIDGFGFGPLGPSGTGFATHYSGRAAADLASPDGAHMRCVFQLVHPSSGMAGGGGGLCQTPGGEIVEVTLAKS